jgi:hypothetical protein
VGEIGIFTIATGDFNIITLEPQSRWRRSSGLVWRWRLLQVVGEIGIFTTTTCNFNIITLDPQSCRRRSSRKILRLRLLPGGG